MARVRNSRHWGPDMLGVRRRTWGAELRAWIWRSVSLWYMVQLAAECRDWPQVGMQISSALHHLHSSIQLGFLVGGCWRPLESLSCPQSLGL